MDAAVVSAGAGAGVGAGVGAGEGAGAALVDDASAGAAGVWALERRGAAAKMKASAHSTEDERVRLIIGMRVGCLLRF